jgi:predicted  nucleic acid-binding Zn-ribbon protein
MTDQLSFIESSNLIHGKRYDYSLVNYKNSKCKVELICLGCNKHFFVTPNDHVTKKSGCKCWRTLSFEEITSRCTKKLGNNIKCHAIRNGKHMREIDLECLLCKRRWWAQISNINQSKGCLKCRRLKPLPFNEAVNRFKFIHKDRYEYKEIDYKKWHHKIKIKCLSCKENFNILPADHIKGIGCTKCFKRKKINNSIFITRANKIHNHSYDYSHVNYKGSLNKVNIGCLTCGAWFEQTPNHHLNLKNGCPECALTKVTSHQENEWLDELGICKSNRQIEINLNNKKFVVDALVDKTIYEYYGSYWHGDPRTTQPNQLIGKNKRRANELYTSTIKRQLLLEQHGYEVRFVWEYDRLNGMLFSFQHPKQ